MADKLWAEEASAASQISQSERSDNLKERTECVLVLGSEGRRQVLERMAAADRMKRMMRMCGWCVCGAETDEKLDDAQRGPGPSSHNTCPPAVAARGRDYREL
eukprot:2277226-Rhodomonas_salina.1